MKIPPKPGEIRGEYKVHSKHYWMHLASGTMVFLLGIGFDIAIGELRYRWPHKVRWISNQISNDHRLGWIKESEFWKTNVPFSVDIGFSDDGIVYWKFIQKTNVVSSK